MYPSWPVALNLYRAVPTSTFSQWVPYWRPQDSTHHHKQWSCTEYACSGYDSFQLFKCKTNHWDGVRPITNTAKRKGHRSKCRNLIVLCQDIWYCSFGKSSTCPLVANQVGFLGSLYMYTYIKYILRHALPWFYPIQQNYSFFYA